MDGPGDERGPLGDGIGFVRLVDSMPRADGDAAIVQAARVSTVGGGSAPRTATEDARLLRYLLSNRHDTPFEMVQTKWHVKCPIFIARQWMRHRTGSFNEISARYAEVRDEAYRPSRLRAQSAGVDRQASADADGFAGAAEAAQIASESMRRSYEAYRKLLAAGVAREQARIVLAQGEYTEFYWSVNARNLLHFVGLRADEHAQWEIRRYAERLLDLVRPLMPRTVAAFEDYRLRGESLSAAEVDAVREGRADLRSARGPDVDPVGRSEQAAYERKRALLRLRCRNPPVE